METKEWSSCVRRSGRSRPERRRPERILADLSARYKEKLGLQLDHRTEKIIDVSGSQLGAELLITHNTSSVQSILDTCISKNNTFDLFALGIMRAFEAIKKGALGYLTVNAYIADVSHPDFRFLINKLLPFYRKIDRSKVVIEFLEYPHGQISDIFIKNVFWLTDMGFHVMIDDCDVLGVDKSGISMDLLQTVGPFCNGIKLDHNTTQAIAKGEISYGVLSDIYNRLQSLLVTNKPTITAEGIRSGNDITKLNHALGVTRFQLAPQEYQEASIPRKARK